MLVALSSLIGCEERKFQPTLLCNGSDALGLTPEGWVGPWVMAKTGPVIADPAGRVTGPAIPCDEAERLLGVKARPWDSASQRIRIAY